MAVHIGSVQARTVKQKIWGEITPYVGSIAPTHEDTEGKGGYMCVANVAARDGINAAFREKGMGVFVQSTEIEYILADDLVTWLESPTALSSNNLYVYSIWKGASNYERYEQYKWHDGRLDTYIMSNKHKTTTDAGPVTDMGLHPRIIWKTRYINTPTVRVAGYDGDGGPCWAVCHDLSNYSITNATVSDSYGEAYAYTIAHGKWK